MKSSGSRKGILEGKPFDFKKGKKYKLSSFDGKLGTRTIHVISVTRDEFSIPKKGRFYSVIITYRWFSDYKGCWLYEADEETALSFKVRLHQRMLLNFKK